MLIFWKVQASDEEPTGFIPFSIAFDDIRTRYRVTLDAFKAIPFVMGALFQSMIDNLGEIKWYILVAATTTTLLSLFSQVKLII